MKRIIYLIILLISINVVLAQNIEVVKEAPQEINLNEILEVKIHISNKYDTEKELLIEEILPQNVEVIDPTRVYTKRNDALEVEYYEWITTINPNSIKTITYKIKPLSLGEDSISSTQVTDNSNLNTYESNSISFKVKCVPNNQCEESETSLTCPQDCSTGGADGVCDYKADGVCDPDCEDEPDCKVKEFNMNYIIFPFIGIIIIILIIWLLPKIFKKKEKYHLEELKKQNNQQIQQQSQTQQQDPLAGIQNNQ